MNVFILQIQSSPVLSKKMGNRCCHSKKTREDGLHTITGPAHQERACSSKGAKEQKLCALIAQLPDDDSGVAQIKELQRKESSQLSVQDFNVVDKVSLPGASLRALGPAVHLNKPKLVTALLKAGADPRLPVDMAQGGITALHVAAQENCIEVMKLLLEWRTPEVYLSFDHRIPAASVDINARIGGKAMTETPLYLAAWHNKPEAVEVLLEAGADWRLIVHKDPGHTAVSAAMRMGNMEVLHVFRKHGTLHCGHDLDMCQPTCSSTMQAAVQKNGEAAALCQDDEINGDKNVSKNFLVRTQLEKLVSREYRIYHKLMCSPHDAALLEHMRREESNQEVEMIVEKCIQELTDERKL
ncbi:unnamed protein product [Amoebophrya sp. A25]|nr:unnamed protein product [Amoebophrya sp. A25]|eukprot:GSA25T00012685001.1